MSQETIFKNKAFQKKESVNKKEFNLINKTASCFSFFETYSLEEREVHLIQNLLTEGSSSETLDQLSRDANKIIEITTEIKSITKQSVLLIGERLFQVRKILKPYKDGTFTKWLDVISFSRKTSYNFLAYYSLFNELPNSQLKEKLKKIPQSIAYTLASREGNIEIKTKIIEDNYKEKAETIIKIINELLPINGEDKRRRRTFLKVSKLTRELNAKLYELERMLSAIDINSELFIEEKEALNLAFRTIQRIIKIKKDY